MSAARVHESLPGRRHGAIGRSGRAALRRVERLPQQRHAGAHCSCQRGRARVRQQWQRGVRRSLPERVTKTRKRDDQGATRGGSCAAAHQLPAAAGGTTTHRRRTTGLSVLCRARYRCATQRHNAAQRPTAARSCTWRAASKKAATFSSGVLGITPATQQAQRQQWQRTRRLRSAHRGRG